MSLMVKLEHLVGRFYRVPRWNWWNTSDSKAWKLKGLFKGKKDSFIMLGLCPKWHSRINFMASVATAEISAISNYTVEFIMIRYEKSCGVCRAITTSCHKCKLLRLLQCSYINSNQLLTKCIDCLGNHLRIEWFNLSLIIAPWRQGHLRKQVRIK